MYCESSKFERELGNRSKGLSDWGYPRLAMLAISAFVSGSNALILRIEVFLLDLFCTSRSMVYA